MDVQQKLMRFAEIDGFLGVALFTPQGKMLASYDYSKSQVERIGLIANEVLQNAQKASLKMGYGRGQLVFIYAEDALILLRCLNEGQDPLQSEPEKTHIHLALILDKSGSLGLAKLEINKVIETLADDFRFLEKAAAEEEDIVEQADTRPIAVKPEVEKKAPEKGSGKHDLRGVADSLNEKDIGNVLDSLLD